MRVFWAVLVGAALGGVSRFYLSGFIQQRTGPDFPLGTLIVNVTGGLLVGAIMRFSLQSDLVSPTVRVMLTSGFCGGYTTFSTFSYETVVLLEDGEFGRAALYVVTSVGLSLAAVLVGFAVGGRRLAGD
jgi:CrcB protein